VLAQIGFVFGFLFWLLSPVFCFRREASCGLPLGIGFVFYPGVVADEAGFAIIFLFQRTYTNLPILTLALFCIFFRFVENALHLSNPPQPHQFYWNLDI